MNFNQLGMSGTSVLYSSGDDGVAGGNGGLCLNSEGCPFLFLVILLLLPVIVYFRECQRDSIRFDPGFTVDNDYSVVKYI